MIIHWLLFVVAGFSAGVINSVAGGGSFIIFPLLVSTGIPAVIANATTTFVVQPGTLTSALGYRSYLKKLPKSYLFLLIPGAIGGWYGAVLLRHTTDRMFGHIVPFFVLIGVALLLLQPGIHRWATKKRAKRYKREHTIVTSLLLTILFFILAIYGGYFGAGYGIVALGLLGLTMLNNIHQMNGLKNLIALSLGISSIVYFTAHHLVNWEVLPPLIIGNIAGGYFGALYASKLSDRLVRTLAITIGITVSILLFTKYY